VLAPEKVPHLLDQLADRHAHCMIGRGDGLRIDWPEERAWLLVRASNTEPIVRAIAEAPTLEKAKQLCAAVQDFV
jgi:phosphomannomutase